MDFKLMLCILCAFGLSYAVDETSDARLLASKTIMNQLMVATKDITIQYNIYNIGGRAALNVRLTDASFSNDFKVVRGFLNVGWQRIAPGSNVTHTVILKSEYPGYHNFTSAEVDYLPSETADMPITGYTSAPGEEKIVSFRDYDRKFTTHLMDWAAFGVMTIPSLCIPLMLWYSSKSKYDKYVQHKKTK